MMLTGLIFATEEAADQQGVLAATLPFGGMTLIEYQARLLAGAGVGQILVAVARVTPALLGAVSRIGKRGTAIDVVRSAEEALAKAHPLSTILTLADGLVTTDAVVAAMALETADALLVTPNSDATAVERVDAGHCWAGVATLSIDRLTDAARLPAEYDFQSTLLRVSTQARARHVPISGKAARSGHGVERDATTLEARSKDVLAALAERRSNWIDRFLFTPISRAVMPILVRRGVPDVAVAAAGGLLALGGLWTMVGSGIGPAALLLFASLVAFSAGSLLSWLRGEDDRAAWQERGFLAVAILGILAMGGLQSLIVQSGVAATLALGATIAAVLVMRVPGHDRAWFATPASQMVLLVPFALADHLAIGLAIAATHGVVSLCDAIETLRRRA